MARIVGNGDIASALKQMESPHTLLFFASGVSNSGETAESEYMREIDLLMEQPKDAHLVYFSSLSVFYGASRYVHHKRVMESVVKEEFPTHTIVRLGNIDFGVNPNTLINYLRAHPEAKVRDEYRYIVGRDEFLHHMSLIPDWSCEYNITGRMLKVQEVKDEYC